MKKCRVGKESVYCWWLLLVLLLVSTIVATNRRSTSTTSVKGGTFSRLYYLSHILRQPYIRHKEEAGCVEIRRRLWGMYSLYCHTMYLLEGCGAYLITTHLILALPPSRARLIISVEVGQ
ncbi:uncharacterized protein F4817DRAFT_192521 [Daldinia loculata]|uniref:uncharacterized protein n=1 Tax=Daldinia loculata TaxID=103429 RepID=UPI0020C2F67F|nr:uncharacterized protein F4817DRAFT_192521 [Daldinia loculata]KAI1645028.1 hypothetical protein F4817DRAFT_192521 [Daldinia loculata]